jgi:hypothetical protein
MARKKRTHPEEQSTFPFRSGAAWKAHGIFSDHFISTRLKDASTWPKSTDEVREAHNGLQELWGKRYVGLAQNEETTRREFIDLVLEQLHFSHRSSLDLPVSQQRRTPDYLLFQDEATKDKVFNSPISVQYSSAVGLLEAKKAFLPLDALSTNETRFPHQQVRDYLDSAADGSGRAYFRWGILTNGNEWRLYCRDAHPSAFFAFYLAGDGGTFCTEEEFYTFLALFSPQAFLIDDGVCLLDDIRSEALQYQTELEQSIRKRIFTVVEDLANGFWSQKDNDLKDEDLKDLYDNCLIFLYRLLFVLYAEGRGLLPVSLSGKYSNELYRTKYSVQRLTTKLKSPKEYTTNALTELYDELLKLFRLIDGGKPAANKACGVPLYNGGLFDPEAHPKLEQWRIGDSSLAEVLRDLIFAPNRKEAQSEFDWGAIDYGDLEVRQLGDIYEGLLGGHLQLDQDKDLLELRGEHSALQESGTFYTPDWVVKFLIERTLEPLVAEIDLDSSIKKAIATDSRNNAFAERVLALNVLDPAMGSGHFLVRATEWLADQIVYHPTTRFISEGAGNTSTEQAEISFWRRRVVEHCIYGVDLNPLAVELAKLSLWLTCIASEEPLNFLDHHVREANALVGATLSNLATLNVAPPEENQITLSLGADFTGDVATVIKDIANIEGQDSTTIDIVKGKAQRWAESVLPRLKPYKTIADVWVAAAAGLPITQFDYCSLGQVLLELQHAESKKHAASELKRLLTPHQEQFDRLTNNLRPFHWELEFPQAFYDSKGQTRENPGFDAILGNPPYISTQTSSDFVSTTVMKSLFGFSDDLYTHFIAKGFKLLREAGQFGFIVSDTFFTLATKQVVRELLQAHGLRYLVQCDPFDATVDAAMFVATKLLSPEENNNFFFIQARYRTEHGAPEADIVDTLRHPSTLGDSGMDFVCEGKSFPVRHGKHGCLRVHKTSIEPYRVALKKSFFEPSDAAIRLYNRFMNPWKGLVSDWWDSIESAKKFAENRASILEYQASLKAGDITLVGLIAEGAQGMRTGNNGRFLGYLEGTPQAERVKARQKLLLRMWREHPRIGPVVRELMESNGYGFEDVVEPLKSKFDAMRVLGLQKGEVYRIVPEKSVATDEEFQRAFEYRSAELREHWERTDGVKDLYELIRKLHDDDFCLVANELVKAARDKEVSFKHLGLRSGEVYTSDKDAPRIAGIFGGLPGARAWVPFRKGDPEGHKWTTSESLMIYWSQENVKYLQEASESRWQGHSYFFLPGVTWTLYANHVALKARLQPRCVFDAGGSRLTPFESVLSTNQFLGFLNSDLFSFIVKRFVKNTQDYEVNDVRMAPLIIPGKKDAKELEFLVGHALIAKQLSLDDKDPSVELLRSCRDIAKDLKSAPAYLQLSPQTILFHKATDCLDLIEAAINWKVEAIYDVEGLGPFNEF